MMLLRPHWPPLGALHYARTTLTKVLTLIRTRARVHRHKFQERHVGVGKVTRGLEIVQIVLEPLPNSHTSPSSPIFFISITSHPHLIITQTSQIALDCIAIICIQECTEEHEMRRPFMLPSVVRWRRATCECGWRGGRRKVWVNVSWKVRPKVCQR